MISLQHDCRDFELDHRTVKLRVRIVRCNLSVDRLLLFDVHARQMEQTERTLRKALTDVWQFDKIGLQEGAHVGIFHRYLQPIPGRKALRFLSDDHTVLDDPRSGADQHHNG